MTLMHGYILYLIDRMTVNIYSVLAMLNLAIVFITFFL
jgi:hypothetical protein